MTALAMSGHADAIEGLFDQPLVSDAIGPHLSLTPHPWCETMDHLDRVGLAADAWRQRWETVRREPRPGLRYQTRPIQPRIPVAIEGPITLDRLSRVLAGLGLRVDHERTPATPGSPALMVWREPGGPECARVRSSAVPGQRHPTVALDELRLSDLIGLLEALGADPSDAIAFEPDGQPPAPVVR